MSNKRVTLHPTFSDGTTDYETDLLPECRIDGIKDKDGNRVEISLKLYQHYYIIMFESGESEFRVSFHFYSTRKNAYETFEELYDELYPKKMQICVTRCAKNNIEQDYYSNWNLEYNSSTESKNFAIRVGDTKYRTSVENINISSGYVIEI